VEFAYLYRAFGAEVTLLEAKERLLPSMDVEIGQELERAFKKKGINVLCKTRALRSRIETSLVRVIYEDRQHAEKELYASQVLVGTGRQPVSDGLGLETLGVQTEQGYIKVAKNFQTSVPSIFAIGDIVGPSLLAHAASEQGKVVVEMIAGVREIGLDSNQIPTCVYSHPEVASIGLSEEEAKSAGHTLKIGKFPFRALGRAVLDGNEDGFVKVVVDGKTGKLLGGQVIGEGATEMIAELTLIRTSGLSVDDVASVIHAYPTLSEAVLEALLASQKRSFNI
jgi:dihydrolipoamide dehydrogenase